MKRYFEIKEYITGERTKIYTIHDSELPLTETDDFFNRFKDDPKLRQDIEIIAKWIRKIGDEGALERYFRPEDKGAAIPIEGSRLRLYCYRVNDEILILGNGGLKTSQLVKNSSDPYPHFQIINDVAFVLKLKESKGQLSIFGNQLHGDLKFYLDTKENE